MEETNKKPTLQQLKKEDENVPVKSSWPAVCPDVGAAIHREEVPPMELTALFLPLDAELP